jgi:hypothetical protein
MRHPKLNSAKSPGGVAWMGVQLRTRLISPVVGESVVRPEKYKQLTGIFAPTHPSSPQKPDATTEAKSLDDLARDFLIEGVRGRCRSYEGTQLTTP